MKALTTLLILGVLLLGATAQQNPAPQSGAPQSNAQQARAILDQTIQALGGEAYLSVQDSQIEGRTGRFYHGSSEGAGLYYRFWQWPNKERFEFTKQRDVIDLFVDDHVYETTFRGTKELDVAKDPNLQLALARRRHTLEIVLRQWLNQKGTALFYEGQVLAENHRGEQVTIMNADNDAVTLVIDSDTHLPVKKTFIRRDPQTRDRDEIAEVYDNWKKIQGVSTPYNMLVVVNGDLTRQYFINNVTYNNNLQSSLFAPNVLNFDRTKK